jgi:hypothetical protein
MTLPLTPEQKAERRKAQLREAQRRHYNAHKKKERGEPKSYHPDYIRQYHTTYYQRNRERLRQLAKERYNAKKETQNSNDTSAERVA